MLINFCNMQNSKNSASSGVSRRRRWRTQTASASDKTAPLLLPRLSLTRTLTPICPRTLRISRHTPLTSPRTSLILLCKAIWATDTAT